MFQLSLKRKIYLGFGIILMLVFGNALAVYVGSKRITNEANRMSEIEAVNAVVLGLDRDVQELRLRADRFVYSGRQSQSDAAKEIFERLRVEIETATRQQTDPELVMLFGQINSRVTEYAKHFDSVIVERKIRQDLVEQQLPALARQIEERTARLSDQFSGFGVSDQNHLALVRSQSAFSRAEKFLLKYFENPDGELVAESIRAINQAVSQLAEMQVPGRQVEEIVQAIRDYEGVGLRAVQATRSYLFLRNVVIAGEESEVSYYSAQLRSQAEARREFIASELAATSRRVRLLSMGIVVTAVGLSLLIATRLALLIVTPISDLTKTFERLSSGEVLADVPGTERADEIGKMATAARIFSDQNQRTTELLQQSQTLGRELREKASQLQATNEELDSFAYVASHDLRSPLRGIKHLAQWIEEDVRDDLSSDGEVYLDNLQVRVGKLEVLLEDLLDFSRVGRINPPSEIVEVHSVLENIVDMVSNPQSIEVKWPDDLPVFETVRPPLEQVFMNLIGNAIKHNDKGRDGYVKVTWSRDDQRFRFSVHDNGPGIESTNFDRIFQMYQRVGDPTVEGSGMGLAIVKKQVEHFGGSIDVESALGRGTTFHFTWPCELATTSPEVFCGASI
ncbi:Phytochrome-like protein cph1 [Stieleria neptunia]|uniref:histidine kinase n=1 Tax=Stieleria neptunia TaxID=2527979 RepID=A0A518HTG9_9BACT|nr:ATP-binding protein [Stieleria neptunia]QDV44148.1 Phytochrome-like protein cph1 [Stieleria neptunia]